jgi:2-oxoacid:acceptor oxidoreductase gamma subunit (pyruvate/2-ketoisovalerate family)
MKEIRIHGRGGQGAVVAARIMVIAFAREGKWGSGFPTFGAERRGAPVMVFVRFDDRPIRERSRVYYPDCLMVIDPRLINSTSIFDGIKLGGVLVLNTAELVRERPHENLRIVGFVDATKIGLEEVGMPITNTCMLGAFARTTGWVGLDSIISSLEEYFSGDILNKNKKCVERGFEETEVLKF